MSATGCATKIHVLSGDVVSRIAAGEVIERPAAVVKELIDNSVDAGSRHVSIDIKEGGRGLIRVADDGEGMSRADLLLAFERHATSKLRSDRDLASIATMGFRGEALPSIASVSNVMITTATRQDTIGAQLTLLGGVAQSVVDAPVVPGTRIEVTDLFHHQPARKKFLKSTSTEFSHISHVVQQAALAWPSVHFRLIHNGQEVLNYPAAASNRDRILQVYRPAFIDQTVEVRGRIAGLAVSGYVIDPVQARASKQPQDLFVNRRPVRNATVFHAVTDGYGSFLPRGHYPTFVLFVDVDPDRIDVNVHPTKKEIRFAETEAVHQLVRHTIRHALGGEERKTVLGLARPAPHRVSTAIRDAAEMQDGPASGTPGTGAIHTILESGQGMPSGVGRTEGSQLEIAEDLTTPYQRPAETEIVPLGQLHRTYLVAQVGHELQVIDQHTAHERVLFERLWRNWQTREIPSQPLLIPEPVELSGQHGTLLRKYLGELERLGLMIEPFGATAVAICAVPAGIGTVDGKALVQDLLDDLAEWETVSSLDVRVRPVLASLACHGAVRAGRAMASPEIRQLIQDWVQEGLIMTCPHGRRTAFRLSTDELDKIFGRSGWS
jgi:DNA mismatch repair protein MutL